MWSPATLRWHEWKGLHELALRPNSREFHSLVDIFNSCADLTTWECLQSHVITAIFHVHKRCFCTVYMYCSALGTCLHKKKECIHTIQIIPVAVHAIFKKELRDEKQASKLAS